MQKNYISAVGGAEPLPVNQETRNQLQIAGLKNYVLAEYGKWLRLDSQVPPRRKLYHPVAIALAAGQIEGICFDEVERLATSNSIWIETKIAAARQGLSEVKFLQLLASSFAQQAQLLEQLVPAEDTK